MSVSTCRKTARKLRPAMVAFLRDLVAIPSESRREEAVVKRIEKEMAEAGFDEIIVDGMGNIRGRIGRGETVSAKF